MNRSGVRASGATLRWAGALLALGLLQRAAVVWLYAPIRYGDTGAYFRLAAALRDLSLSGYDGTRTPAYPALIALLGMDETRLWLVQLAMGVAITMMFFAIWMMTVGGGRMAFFVGLLYDLIPGLWLFESNLLTETLTAFLLTLTLFLLTWFLSHRDEMGKALLALGTGLAAALAGMARPLFFPLTVWLLPFVALKGSLRWRPLLARAALYSLPPLILQGGWLLFMRSTYHMLSPTTMAGYSMVQHTGAFFEYLPDEDALLRDIYLEYRDRHVERRGVQTNAVWDAIPAMSAASGLSFHGLSRELYRLSWKLIRAHPMLYLKSVFQGWVWFWKAPVYWDEAAASGWMRPALGAWAAAGRAVNLAANLLFLALSGLALFFKRWRERLRLNAFAIAVGGMIWLFSILQTIVDHGDNPRFLIPLQMMVIYFVVRCLYIIGRKPAPQENFQA